MKILAVDIGTGTQDIYLYNSNLDMENNFKLVVPSPTMIIHRQIKQATAQRSADPVDRSDHGRRTQHWAVEAHLRAGLPVYATPELPGRSMMTWMRCRRWGLTLVSEDEA